MRNDVLRKSLLNGMFRCIEYANYSTQELKKTLSLHTNLKK